MRLFLPLILACSGPGADKDPGDTHSTDTADDSGAETGEDSAEDSAEDTAEEEEEDTAPAFSERGCHDDGDEHRVEATGTVDGVDYRVLTLPTAHFSTFSLVVFTPADGTRAWTDGAPVIAVAPPAFAVDASVAVTPRPTFDASYGIIEVQPVYPGWTVAGGTTSGSPDDGGLETAGALFEAIRFAIGESTDLRDHDIGQLLGIPICNARVGVLGLGAGGVAVMAALAANPDLDAHLAGIATFETPALPQLLIGDAGLVWMDPDPESDADGNGFSWDDGRNIDWTAGSCDTINCVLDYNTISWDPDLRLSDLYPDLYPDSADGVFYLDRAGSGALEFGDNGLDIDGDGAVDSAEDFVLLPYVAEDGTPYYSSQTLRKAAERMASWPDGVATWTEADVFFATRNAIEEGKVLVAGVDPSVPAVVGYSAVDGLIALPDRPHSVLVHDLFSEAGFPTRYNLRGAALDCLVDPAARGDWEGGPVRGTALAEGELDLYAIPEAVGDETAAAITGLAALWDGLGAFDHCPF